MVQDAALRRVVTNDTRTACEQRDVMHREVAADDVVVIHDGGMTPPRVIEKRRDVLAGESKGDGRRPVLIDANADEASRWAPCMLVGVGMPRPHPERDRGAVRDA
jgi:hypothetical protein